MTEQREAATTAPKPVTSKRVTDHLANERTFLAWIRTGLATIAFGFVVERFGLLVRELGLKNILPASHSSIHFSSIIGVGLTVLGVIIMVVALLNFLQIRRQIDLDAYHPQQAFAIVLTILTSLAGIILAVYLFLTA